MTKIIRLFFSIAIFFGAWSYPAKPTDILRDLQAEFEKEKKAYWTFKTEALKTRKEMDSEIEFIERELNSLYAKKNSLQEDFYLVKENKSKLKEESESRRAEQKSLKIFLQETVNKEMKNNRRLFPYLVEESILYLTRVSGHLEKDDMRDAMDAYFNYRLFLLDESEKMEISENSVFNPLSKKAVSAKIVRLGFIHQSLTSDEEEGFLLRKTDLSGVSYSWNFDLKGGVQRDIRQSVLKAYNGSKEKYLRFLVDASQAGGKIKGLYQTSSETVVDQFIRFFQSGGVLMYPLFLVAFCALGITVERGIVFFRSGRNLPKTVNEIIGFLKKGDTKGAMGVCELKSNLITRIFFPLLKEKTDDRESMERLLEESILTQVSTLERRLSTLAVLAVVSPLMGLLGTVAGMIALFDVITLYGTNNPKILAGGISIALVTTQTGLSIAIPTMLAHHALMRIKSRILLIVEKNTDNILNRLFSK